MKRKLLNSETDKLQSIIEASNIPVTKSTKECIDAYLKDIKEEIGKNSPEISDDDSKMLFFTKMKRFIMTAYNNLYDMDSGFFDDKLRRLKDELFNLERILNDVHLRLVNLDNAYSNIFLQEQLNYILVERAIELNRDRISMYRSSEISLKRNLDLKEALFQKDPSNELLESEVKRIRKQYTDFSCEYSNVKDETKLLNQLRLQFKDRYLDEFTLGLSDKLSKLESLITNVLNHKAYDLDCDLWTKAKKSESIKKFFQLSKIEGTYSSKTYLKYFLKNLDDNLISEMQQELKDILLYLQEITEKDILIVGKNESRIESLHKLVENIDKDYVVKSFNRTFGA